MRRSLYAWACLPVLVLATVARADEGDDPTIFESAMRAVFEWLLCRLVELVKPPLEQVIDVLPTDWLPNFESFVYWLNAANYWIPLDWAFSMLLIYYGIEVAYLLFSWFLKLLPWK